MSKTSSPSSSAIERELSDLRCIVLEFAKGYTAEFEKLNRGVAQIQERQASVIPADIKSRLDDLEMWRAKVHRILVEISPTGKEKPTREARGFAVLYNKQT